MEIFSHIPSLLSMATWKITKLYICDAVIFLMKQPKTNYSQFFEFYVEMTHLLYEYRYHKRKNTQPKKFPPWVKE